MRAFFLRATCPKTDHPNRLRLALSIVAESPFWFVDWAIAQAPDGYLLNLDPVGSRYLNIHIALGIARLALSYRLP